MSKSFFYSCLAYLFVFLFLSLFFAINVSASETVELVLSQDAQDFFSSIVSFFAGIVAGYAAIQTWGSWR